MLPIARSIVFVVLSSLACHLPGQTAAVNAQRPARPVESVLPATRIRSEAARLDALLEHGLQRRREEPTALVDDAAFVRRAHLTVVGRIPTLAETEAFLADQDQNKRSALCDRLLDSPGHTSHVANYWFDLLRVKSRQRQLSGEPFAHWLRESIQQDKPFDQFVREMLIAAGPAHQQGNGATGYLLRDMNMPHDAMANTLRLFLGTRLECAQCHNHPFDTWTQKEFFEMAAFFGGINYRVDDALPNAGAARTQLASADERTRQAARQLLQRMSQGLAGTGSGVERLPADYKYEDAKPQAPILANTIFGADVKLKYPENKAATRPVQARRQGNRMRMPEVNSREALADWMTSKKNPQFTKVVVNRVWARTFGKGLVEPIDDWKKGTEAVHPELFAQLEKLLIDLDYDLRQFERVLVNMQLFQRRCPGEDPAAEQGYTFRGPMLRRMTAEQIWDSLLTLVFDDLDERLRSPDVRAKDVYDQFATMQKATAAELIAMAGQRYNPGQMQREQQAMRQEEMRKQLAADGELQKRARPLIAELQKARRDGDQKRLVELVAELERMGAPIGQRNARGREGDMLRASDLQQPAPENHLLRQFGQSDRETIDGSSTDATVPQVLTLLNGFLDQRVIEGNSALKRDLSLATNGERRVRIAYLTTLNREPTVAELQEWRRAIAIDGESVTRDLVWVLCNSNEFRFVQ